MPAINVVDLIVHPMAYGRTIRDGVSTPWMRLLAHARPNSSVRRVPIHYLGQDGRCVRTSEAWAFTDSDEPYLATVEQDPLLSLPTDGRMTLEVVHMLDRLRAEAR